jgi:hypothetical protein
MEASTQAALILGLTTLALPLGVSAGVMKGGERLTERIAKGAHLPGLMGLSAGLLVSFMGVISPGRLWGVEATKWLLWAPLFGALALEGLSGLTRRRAAQAELGERPALLVFSVVVVLSLLSYLTLAPLAGLWREGVSGPLTSAWLISPIALGALTLTTALSSLKGERVEESPAWLAALALSFAGAALVVGLSGSVSLAQLLGAYGLSVTAIGARALLASRSLSLGVYALGYLSLFVTLLYAHFYLVPALSVGPATLLLVAPLGAQLTRSLTLSPWKRALCAVLCALPFVASALTLTTLEQLKAQEAQAAQEVDEFGASY